MIQRASLVFASIAFVTVVACSSSSSDDGAPGSGSSDIVSQGETCGGPPPTALCAPCPGDFEHAFKQVNGKPTCDCCGSTPTNPPPKPACCDEATKPPPGREGVWCCADGWQYDIGSGKQSASCASHGGAGTVCQPPPPPPPPSCCDPATKPPPGLEGVWCCADGWQYDIGVGNETASCKSHGGAAPVCGSK